VGTNPDYVIADIHPTSTATAKSTRATACRTHVSSAADVLVEGYTADLVTARKSGSHRSEALAR
jgi:hypothetical protein